MKQFLTDVKQLAYGHPAATALICVSGVLAVTFYVYAVLMFSTRLNTMQNNICAAVAQQERGNPVQYRFWSGAADRARLRAQTEGPALAALDRDSAAQDLNIAEVYAPRLHPYRFPGC